MDAYGQIGHISKRRILFLVGNTRIHLDRVEKLGSFLELEVVLEDAEMDESGIMVAQQLLGHLGIASSQFIDGSYLDLMQE